RGSPRTVSFGDRAGPRLVQIAHGDKVHRMMPAIRLLVPLSEQSSANQRKSGHYQPSTQVFQKNGHTEGVTPASRLLCAASALKLPIRITGTSSSSSFCRSPHNAARFSGLGSLLNAPTTRSCAAETHQPGAAD